MATIDQLTVSILDMSEQEAFDLVKHLRQVRRTRPAAVRTHRKSAKGTRDSEAIIKGKGHKVDPMILAGTLTPGQRAALLKELGVDV